MGRTTSPRPSELLPVNSFANWPGVFAQLGSGKGAHPFRTTRDYDNFLARMDGFVAWVDQAINNLRAGVTKGVVLPQDVVERTLPQLEAFGRHEDPRQTVFWQPLLNFPAGPSVDDRRRLLQAYDEKLRIQVLPAYRRLHDYLAQEYLPRARATVSWSDLPSGDLWYAHLVRYYTSTNMTPADVHELGLREVARLRASLVGLQGTLGIAGEPRAVFDALRADPRFQFGDVQAMLAGYAALHDRVDARLPALFLRRPQATFAVRPVEGFRAASATAASYSPQSAAGAHAGVLYVNTSELASRPSYALDALYLGEAVPGRFYLAAIAQETPDLPRFRRFGDDAALVAGWALYAQSLGTELGLYADPYSQFGALNVELWRAAALVVDTGLHAQGWSRQRAGDFLRENTALGEADIAAEVDRYVACPGQALADKIGQLKILELRRRADEWEVEVFARSERERDRLDALLTSGALLWHPHPMMESPLAHQWLQPRTLEWDQRGGPGGGWVHSASVGVTQSARPATTVSDPLRVPGWGWYESTAGLTTAAAYAATYPTTWDQLKAGVQGWPQ